MTMKLWLLRPNEDRPKENDPWSPWYDRCFGFVVRAGTEEEARAFAAAAAGEEKITSWDYEKSESVTILNPWADAAYSTCVDMSAADDPGVVIGDYRNA